MWSNIRQDVTYAVRSFRRTPGFAAIAIVTLALGIGANTAIFSVINAVLLRPLPYRDADRIVFVWSNRDGGRARDTLAPARFLDFRTGLSSVSAMAGICQFSVTLTGGGDPEQLPASSVSSSFFDVLGARPMLGEPFHAGTADDRAVVLSHGLWIRRFGADPAIVGRTVTLNGTSRRIVAVMARDFLWPAVTTVPGLSDGPELWIPGAAHDIPRTPADNPAEDLSTNRQLGILRAVARLRDGVTVEQAQREAEIVASRLASTYPPTDGARSAEIVTLRAQFFGPATRPLAVLLGAVAFVLALACVNVASLLIGRATSRRQEMAVRLALGAGRGRIIRQLLTESLVLSGAGAALGLLLAWWASRWFVGVSPGGAQLPEAGLDLTVLWFSLVAAVCTGIAFGIVPAWQVSRTEPEPALRDGGSRGATSGAGSRTRDALVVIEVAVALVLLVGAGLMLRSFNALASVDTGIDLRNLLTFEVAPRNRGIAPGPGRSELYRRLLERLDGMPGVTSAGAAVTLPIGGDTFSTSYLVEGQPVPPEGQEPSAGYQIVSPGYFDALGTRVLAGRPLRDSDAIGAPLVVAVNDTLARAVWPGLDPIGRRIRFGRAADDEWFTVVAVVSDVRHGGPSAPPRPEVYQSSGQRSFGSMAFVVRTVGDPLAIVPMVRREVASLAPGLPISQVATMEQHVARALSRPRFLSLLVGAFGAIALALAIVGIYGVMTHAVTERTQEIAIRMALGARGKDVLWMVLRKAIVLGAGGVVVGVAAAAGLTGVLTALLHGVTPADPLTFGAASVVLLAVTVLAASVPAVRASRIGVRS